MGTLKGKPNTSVTSGNAGAWICITHKTFDRLMKLAKQYTTLNEVIEVLLEEYEKKKDRTLI